jgi:peptide/nickel transport system substrate-binding protein
MSDKPTEVSPFERKISRRDLLEKAGKIGAGAVVASALAGPAAAATRRVNIAKKVPLGGSIIWALEQDPGHIAPFGGILTANHWGNELMYDSLLEWDPKLNVRNALIESYKVVNPRRIVWTLKKGVKFSNGKEVTAADAKYSFDLQANPPLPGSVAVLGQFPAIASTTAIGKYTLQMDLKAPDARVYGYLAWGRYSAIVPEGMYQQLDPSVNGIGTGPFKLAAPYQPNNQIQYVKNPNFWRSGQPYLDSITYRIITDEQTRVAALRAGSIQGATVGPDSAAALNGAAGLTVLRGLTADFRELQMTIKPGENKPWHIKEVRQAVNHAINRQNIIDKVYNGFGQYSGHVAAGYGPWPLSADELRTNYEKYDLPMAKSLMSKAGVSGFDVTMTTFATPLDYQSVSALVKADLAQIGINVNIVPQDTATFAARNGTGQFDWDLTGRGMRGDVDGYVAEFHPAATAFKAWYPEYKNIQMFRLIGNGRITLDPAKRLPMYQTLNKVLLTEALQVPLVSRSKFQVVSNKLKNMYVAFSDFNPGLRYVYLVS